MNGHTANMELFDQIVEADIAVLNHLAADKIQALFTA